MGTYPVDVDPDEWCIVVFTDHLGIRNREHILSTSVLVMQCEGYCNPHVVYNLVSKRPQVCCRRSVKYGGR